MSFSARNISVIVILAGILRLCFAVNLPLSGDEGISLLQASGHAHTYSSRLPDGIFPVESIKEFIDYSDGYSVRDVLSSMRYNGMHPPLYYLGLHYVIKYTGNNAILLRILSILFSLCSIFMIYRLGKTVDRGQTGIYCALFLAISPYAIMYGTIVRPYPLAMMLALLSTLHAITLKRPDGIGIGNRRLTLYALTVILGLYTIYHFIFVFIFQLVFLFAVNLRDKRAMIKIGIVTLLVGVSYLPWIPSLLGQLRAVNSREFYFHGGFNIETLFRSIAGFNFSAFYMIYRGISATKMLAILFIPMTLIIWGYIHSLRDKGLRLFAGAAITAILINFLADRIMGTNTLNVPKLSFFITPLALIFLAIGISHVTDRRHLRVITLFICCGLLAHGGIRLYKTGPNFDGPPVMKVFKARVIPSLEERQRRLYIINTSQRRYITSLAHTIKSPADVMIHDPGDIESELSETTIEDYHTVILFNCYITYSREEFLSDDEILDITDFLSGHGFGVSGRFPGSAYSSMKSSITVFEKTPHGRQAPAAGGGV